jgi:moderate conductance mechanosensitive channel
MHRLTIQVILACLIALLLPAALSATRHVTVQTGNTVSPNKAPQGVDAVASAVPSSPPHAATSPPVAQPAAASSPSAAPSGPAIAPLETNGLVVQMIRQVDRWGDSLGNQLHQVKHAMLGVPAMLGQFSASLGDASGEALLTTLLSTFILVFVVGLAVEWGMRRMLSQPRLTLIKYANQTERETRTRSARAEVLRRPHWEQQQKMAGDAALGSQVDGNAGSIEGMRSPPDGVGLVHNQRDGVDRVEAISTETGDKVSRAEAGLENTDLATGDPHNAGAPLLNRKRNASSNEHRIRIGQLPFAFGVLLLDLLPVALFFFTAALLLYWIGDNDEQIKTATRALIDAYVSTRVTMVVLGLLISPDGHGVPVLRVRREISSVMYTWLRRIVVTAAFGTAIADLTQALGAGTEVRLAVLKIVSLLAHLFAVSLIFRIRRPVGRMIAAPMNASGLVASVRGWLAESWAYIATLLVMGVWLVWALGIEDGFPKLIHFIGVTTGIIIAARILAILVFGLMDRSFHTDDAAAASSHSTASVTPPILQARLERYYPVVHRLLSAIISVGTVLALLQAWGLDAIGWFMHGAVGRNLLSALSTIAVAIVVAVLVWDAANTGVERRLAYWSQQGDLVHAARLRTLLPILRTCLFIVIVLVVGLTALNEIGINTTPLLASASIVGVALGFGSQKLVQDFITGIFLLMENAMQVGDWVTVAGVAGTVEHLSIRTVRLRAGDGSLHIVPFSSVSTVNNTNRGLGNAVMRISVSYGSDIEQVISELKQIGAGLRQNPAFTDQILNDIEVWGVDSVDGSMVTILGQIRCTDKGRWGVQRELNRQILERFRELGIQIADPRTTMVLSGEASSSLVSVAQRRPV